MSHSSSIRRERDGERGKTIENNQNHAVILFNWISIFSGDDAVFNHLSMMFCRTIASAFTILCLFHCRLLLLPFRIFLITKIIVVEFLGFISRKIIMWIVSRWVVKIEATLKSLYSHDYGLVLNGHQFICILIPFHSSSSLIILLCCWLAIFQRIVMTFFS